MIETIVEAPELVSLMVSSNEEPDSSMVRTIVDILEKKGFKVNEVPKIEFIYDGMWNLVFMKES